MQFEYNLSGKWLELLKQIVPGADVGRSLRDRGQYPPDPATFAAIQSVAPSMGVESSP